HRRRGMLQQELCSYPLPFSDQGRDVFLTRSGTHTYGYGKLCKLYCRHIRKRRNLGKRQCIPKGGIAMTSKKDGLLVAMAALGFLLATVAGIIVWEVPSFSQVLHNPITDVLVVLVALATSVALLLWARQPGHRD